jgi:hypothetical protein
MWKIKSVLRGKCFTGEVIQKIILEIINYKQRKKETHQQFYATALSPKYIHSDDQYLKGRPHFGSTTSDIT